MTTLHKTAQQALEALLTFPHDISDEMFAAIAALKAALSQEQAEPVQEPEGLDWRYTARIGYVVKPYTAPPQHKPLTEEEIDALWRAPMSADWEHREFARAIERAHGIGGQDE